MLQGESPEATDGGPGPRPAEGHPRWRLLGATGDEERVVREAAIGALDGMGVAALAVGLATLLRPMLRDGAPERAIESGEGEVLPPWAERVLGRLPGGGG
jgi:hypothetical protein